MDDRATNFIKEVLNSHIEAKDNTCNPLHISKNKLILKISLVNYQNF
jgi:hypothetical protein